MPAFSDVVRLQDAGSYTDPTVRYSGEIGDDAWNRLTPSLRNAWAATEGHFETHLRAEIEQLRARVAELETERDAIVGKLGEAVELAKRGIPYMHEYLQDDQFERVQREADALGQYHASLHRSNVIGGK